MQAVTLIVYRGRDNALELSFTEDGQPKAASSLSKVELHFDNGKVVSSVEYPQLFDLGSVAKVKLGLASVPKGEWSIGVVGFDEQAPNGLVYGTLPVTIV